MFQGFRAFASASKPGRPARARLILTCLLIASLLSVGAVGSVAAHDTVVVEPGASGSCDNADGEGGSFEVHQGDHVEHNSLMGPDEARSTIDAITHFVEHGGECESEHERESTEDDDYFEVHVNSAAQNAQYCYSEDSDGDSGDSGTGDEPTDSVTAGAGIGEVNVGEGSRDHPPRGDGYCDYNRDGTESGSTSDPS